jgi:6-phosphofructokinase 1
VGKAAVQYALQGKTAVMPVIKRVSDTPYRWKIESAPLGRIANKEKMLPRRYITQDGFGITEACRRYLQPLIKGENYPPYINGLPKTVKLKNKPVKAKVGTKFVV